MTPKSIVEKIKRECAWLAKKRHIHIKVLRTSRFGFHSHCDQPCQIVKVFWDDEKCGSHRNWYGGAKFAVCVCPDCSYVVDLTPPDM